MKKKRYQFLEILYKKDKIAMKYTLNSDSFSFHSTKVEEMFMKWMNRPSVTEMNRGGVYKMERRIKCKIN